MTCSSSKNQTPSFYFEEDVQVLNRMIEAYEIIIEKRAVSAYELSSVLKAIQSVAELIKAKADKQTALLKSVKEG